MANAGAIAIKDDWRERMQVIRPIINEDSARRLGLTKGEISNALYTHLTRANIGTFREGDAQRPIVMRPVETAHNEVGALRDIQVFSQVIGGYVLSLRSWIVLIWCLRLATCAVWIAI